jgi:methyl-accepting chemotaxis protein
VSSVAEAATRQARAISQINAAIVDMGRLTDETAGRVDRSSDASRSLAGEVDELVRRVGRFRTSGR